MEKEYVFNDPKPQQLASADPTQHERESAFERDLAGVINKHSRENGSNTPDFILAAYLVDCLQNFDRIMLWRQKWYSPEGVPAAERINGPKRAHHGGLTDERE